MANWCAVLLRVVLVCCTGSTTTPSATRRATSPSQAALELQAEVDAAEPGATIPVTPGTYAFNSANFQITRKVGLRLLALPVRGGASDAASAVNLLFGLGYGVVVHSSQDLAVVGHFAIDYTEHPSSQGTIYNVSADCFSTSSPPKNCTLDIVVDAGFQPPDPAVRPDLCNYPACETKLVLFSPKTGNMLRPQITNWLYDSTKLPPMPSLPQQHEQSPQQRYRLTTLQMWAHNVAVGDVVAVASRRCGPCTYQVINSTNVVTKGLAIHGSCNMAVWELGGGGGNVYDSIQVIRAPMTSSSLLSPSPSPLPPPPPPHPHLHPLPLLPTPTTAPLAAQSGGGPPRLASQAPTPAMRYLVSNFDGIHSEGSMVGPTIINSTLEHIGDDFFNIQNAIDIVVGIVRRNSSAPATTIVVADKSFGSTFPVTAETSLRFFTPSHAPHVWGGAYVWESTIKSSTLLQGAEAAKWMPLANNLSAAFNGRYGWNFQGFLASGFQLYALELAATIPATVGYTMYAQVNSTYSTTIRDNSFADGASRVGPVNSPHSKISGNVFNGTMLGGLLLSAETTWLSGNLGLSDINITSNVFVDCCSYTRAGFPNGQCNSSTGGGCGGGVPFPVYNPAGTTNIWLGNNTVF